MDLSVCIVNWNTRELLRGCLHSIFETTRDIDFEVIVVDNASSDGSAETVSAEYPQVVLIANSENRGFSGGNNQAIRTSRGRFVMLLNPDTVVHSGLHPAVHFLDRWPEAAAAGCKVLNPDGSVQVSWNRWYPGLWSELFGRRMEALANRLTRFAAVDRVFAAAWVGGVCMTVRREAVDRVGLLDEGYFMYTEEADWCRRFRAAGLQVLHCPDVVITHFGGQSAGQVKTAMRVELVRSKIRFMTKFRSRAEAGLYRGVVCATEAVREAAARVMLAVTRDADRFGAAAAASREFRKSVARIPVEPVRANG